METLKELFKRMFSFGEDYREEYERLSPDNEFVCYSNPDAYESYKSIKNDIVDAITEILESDVYLHVISTYNDGYIRKTITNSKDFPSKEFGINPNAVTDGFISWSFKRLK